MVWQLLSGNGLLLKLASDVTQIKKPDGNR
jgi:hypothetical protein